MVRIVRSALGRSGPMLVAAFLLLAFIAPAGADPSFVFEGKTHRLTARSLKGRTYLELRGVVDAIGGTMQVSGKKRKSIHVECRGKSATLSSRQKLVSADGVILDLRAPVELIQKEIFVPDTFMTSALPRLVGTRIRYDSGTDTYSASAGRTIDVSVDFRSFSDHTRIVFRCSERVPFTLLNPPGRIIVRMQGAGIRSDLATLNIEDGAVRSVTFRQGAERGTFEISLGGSYKDYRTSQFDDPFRLLVDIGRRDRRVPKELPRNEPEVEPSFPEFPEPQAPPSRARSPKPFKTIVLDPGHGGMEVGAQGPSGLLEKDVVLSVALGLKRILETNLGLEVLVTRSRDVEMSLQERTAFANYQKADLFVSLHCNASLRSNARGAETYFLSQQASDQDARDSALRENYPGGAETGAGDASDLDLILWDMAQTEYLKESESLAEVINYELCKTLDIKNRGVKQAPFTVLMGATMPAVLVEIAFISNPSEERALKSEEFKIKIATALYKSIYRFKNSYEQKRGLTR